MGCEKDKRPPPDRNTKSPGFDIPEGAWDCHFHVIGPQLDYPLRSDLSMAFEDSTFDDYLRMQDSLGLTRGLLVQSGLHGYNYQQILDLLRQYPQRLRGVVMLAPDVSGAEIVRLTDAGVVGIRFYPQVAPFDPNILRRVQEHGWSPHYLLPQNDEQAFAMGEQILAQPGNFIIEHAGFPNWQEGINGKRFQLVLKLLETGRCWVKLSPLFSKELAPPYSDTILLNRKLVELFPNRVLWGSDWPHPSWPKNMANDGELLDLLALWASEQSIRKQILVENPETLFL